MRNINLLPMDYRPAPKFVFKRVLIVLFLCILTLGIVGSYLILKINISQTNRLIEGKEQSISIIERNLLANQDNNVQLQNIKAMVTTIENLRNNSAEKSAILRELQRHIPSEIELTNLAIYPEGISFSCQTDSLENIAQLLLSLNTWERYHGFTIAQINSSEENFVFQVQGQLKRGEEQ